MGAFKDLIMGARSLIEGMGMTLKQATGPTVTVAYPHERAEVAPAQRNAIQLIRVDETASHNCIACQQCQKVCPSRCIVVEGSKREGIAFKRPDKFELNFALCSECGLCLDICPTETLGYSTTYDHAGYRRDDFAFDLLEPWRDSEPQTLEHLREAEAKKKAARAAAAAEKPPAKPAEPPAKPAEGTNPG